MISEAVNNIIKDFKYHPNTWTYNVGTYMDCSFKKGKVWMTLNTNYMNPTYHSVQISVEYILLDLTDEQKKELLSLVLARRDYVRSQKNLERQARTMKVLYEEGYLK